MKVSELAPCQICGEAHTAPMLFRVQLEQFVVDHVAAQRAIGQEMMMGPLAKVLGEDVEIAKPLGFCVKILCVNCATKYPVLALLDDSDDDEPIEKGDAE